VFLDKSGGRALRPYFPGMNCRCWRLMSRFRVSDTHCAGFQSSALVASSPNHFSYFGCERGERFIAFSDERGCVVGIRRIARQVVDNLRVRAKRSVLRWRRSQTRRRRADRRVPKPLMAAIPQALLTLFRDSTASQIQGFLARSTLGFMRGAAFRKRSKCPQRDSNPRYHLERVATWAASRWGRSLSRIAGTASSARVVGAPREARRRSNEQSVATPAELAAESPQQRRLLR
jgi:hypothetical protein